MSDYEFIRITDSHSPEFGEAVRLYRDTFALEERQPTEFLQTWVDHPDDQLAQRRAWLMQAKGRPEGFCFWAYLPYYKFGYLFYLGTRGQWRGQSGAADRALATAVFEQMQQLGARLCFWETRSPFEMSVAASEKMRRFTLLKHWQLIGGVGVPVDYTYPPVSAGQPPVPYLMLAHTFPEQRPITKKEAGNMALASLCGFGGAQHGDDHVLKALDSIEVNWRSLKGAYERQAKRYSLTLPEQWAELRASAWTI